MMTALIVIYTVPDAVAQRVKMEKAGSSDPAFSIHGWEKKTA